MEEKDQDSFPVIFLCVLVRCVFVRKDISSDGLCACLFVSLRQNCVCLTTELHEGGVVSAAAEEQPPAAEMIAWINTDKIHEMIGFDTHR